MEKEVVVDEREATAGDAVPNPTDAQVTNPLPSEPTLATRFLWKIYSTAWGACLAGTAYPVVFAVIVFDKLHNLSIDNSGKYF